MPRFAANLTWMFTELPLLDRFAAAADAGFEAVEVLFPYEAPAVSVAERLQRHGLDLVLINCPPGEAGERGLAALPGRFDDLKASVETALAYAAATGAPRLHLMSGLADRRDPDAAAAFRRSVAWAAERVAASGLDIMLEPINGRDVPGYFLDDFGVAEQLIHDLALPNVRLQFDIYHCQILHGDVTTALRRLMPLIGHIQVASVPSRNEPDREELNHPFLMAELDRLGYSGHVGCEYRPADRTADGLGWLAPFTTREPVK